jgi:DNA-binding LacI/PurR family transcriptional regulator
LNNYPDVREETRIRVLRMAREVGYYPNALARGLKTNRTYNLGVLLDDEMRDSLLHTFFVVILNGFRREAERSGYDITLINRNVGERKRGAAPFNPGASGAEPPSRMTFLNHCRNRNLDGVCLMCVDFHDPQVRELVDGEIACISIDHRFDERDCILADNRGGMRELVSYAASQGHRQIAFAYGSPCYVTDVRVGTFRETMAELGLPVRSEFMVASHYHSSSHASETVRRLLALPERPTCILMPDDFSALAGIEVARSQGLAVPRDLSFMGYDGTELIQKIHPRLTTVNQHGDEMGERAARMLIRRLDSAEITAPDIVIVPSALIPGETVARLGNADMRSGTAIPLAAGA